MSLNTILLLNVIHCPSTVGSRIVVVEHDILILAHLTEKHEVAGMCHSLGLYQPFKRPKALALPSSQSFLKARKALHKMYILIMSRYTLFCVFF